MIDEFQKESVLIWSVGIDHSDSTRVCRDIARFASDVAGKENGSMTFLTWGLLIILDEMLESDLETKLLLETPWGDNLVAKAKEQGCNQIQVITAYRLPVVTSIELIK